jgi:hypothetical protein
MNEEVEKAFLCAYKTYFLYEGIGKLPYYRSLLQMGRQKCLVGAKGVPQVCIPKYFSNYCYTILQYTVRCKQYAHF